MKLLCLKGYKWLMSQNQQVRNDFFGYGQYLVMTKYTKHFLEKHYTERLSVP